MNRLINVLTACLLLMPAASAAVSVDDVIMMSKAGLSEGVIIAQLGKETAKFNLSTSDLIKLKSAGVSDGIIKSMVAGPSAQAASAPVASAEPVEIGIMFKKKGEWTEVNPEVVNWKTGGVLKSLASAGVLKGDVNGNVTGASSRNSVNSPLEFRIVTPKVSRSRNTSCYDSIKTRIIASFVPSPAALCTYQAERPGMWSHLSQRRSRRGFLR